MTIKNLNGIITALVTPFDDKGQVNLTSLREMVRYNLSMGVVGFYVNGTTAESFSLTAKERMRIVEIVRSEAADRAGIIVNVSHMEFDVVMELAEHAKSARADLISTLPPLYFSVSTDEVLAYYFELLKRVQIDLVLYNIPMLTGKALDRPMVLRLAEHPRFVGVKHTSDDTHMIDHIKQIDDGRLMVWNSRDASYLSGLSMGADGAVSGSSNLIADLYHAITRTYRAGRVEQALAIQTKINQIYGQLTAYGAIRSIKRCYTMMGIDSGGCRLPFQPISAEADPHLRETLQLIDRTRKELSDTFGKNAGDDCGGDDAQSAKSRRREAIYKTVERASASAPANV